MFIKDGKRFNIYAAVTIEDVNYPAGAFSDPELRDAHGITELPDPVKLPDETHFNQEVDVAPYLVSTPKPLSMVMPGVLAKINSRCDELIGSIKATYPENEVASWSKQESEARDFILNGDLNNCKLLANLAAARDLDPTLLANLIIAKADAFAVVCGAIIGTRQRLEKQIEALPEDATLEQLMAIHWPED
jgi:hypothetical protein